MHLLPLQFLEVERFALLIGMPESDGAQNLLLAGDVDKLRDVILSGITILVVAVANLHPATAYSERLGLQLDISAGNSAIFNPCAAFLRVCHHKHRKAAFCDGTGAKFAAVA